MDDFDKLFFKNLLQLLKTEEPALFAKLKRMIVNGQSQAVTDFIWQSTRDILEDHHNTHTKG